jgi:hypothetical protein
VGAIHTFWSLDISFSFLTNPVSTGIAISLSDFQDFAFSSEFALKLISGMHLRTGKRNALPVA